MNTIKTKHHWHENTSIEFTDKGIWMRLSLNITAEVASKLSPNNVQRGKHHIVYALRAFIESDMINKENLECVHKMLLNNCMNNIRKAKEKLLIQVENGN